MRYSRDGAQGNNYIITYYMEGVYFIFARMSEKREFRTVKPRKKPPPPPMDDAPPVPSRPIMSGFRSARGPRPSDSFSEFDSVSPNQFQQASPRAKKKSTVVRLASRRATVDGRDNNSIKEVLQDSPVSLRAQPKKEKKKKKKTRSSRSKKRKKAQKKQFPVKICLPNGKQAVLKSKVDATVKKFTDYCIKKLQVMKKKSNGVTRLTAAQRYDVRDDFVLCTEEGVLLNMNFVLYECEYIIGCIEISNTIPILCLCPSARDRHSSHSKTLIAANKEEIARLVRLCMFWKCLSYCGMFYR